MRIIAGEARGRIINAPSGTHTRPTLDRVRENLFNMIQNDVPGSRVLDLFAGSGALSLEALSRGAVSAVLVDSDRNACSVQKKNINLLHYEDRTKLFQCDWQAAVRELNNAHQNFDLVFLDPPYAMLDLRKVFESIVPLSGPETLVILEHEAGKEPAVPGGFTEIKSRAWGFCGVTLYRMKTEGE